VGGVTYPSAGPTADDSAFLRACRGLPRQAGTPADRVPVWFMRQAGRSLPEYRALRGEGTILDAIAKPDLAAAITLQPVQRYGVDAAILYSDIVVPISAIGFGVDVAPGTGPVVEQPFVSSADLDRIRPLEPELDTPHVLETIRILVDELEVPLIGFAGAPFTVASYLIEGQPSRTYARTKALMHGDPGLWHALMERLADLAVSSLRSQVDAGASAVQLFDSWVGDLSALDYGRFVQPHTTRIFEQIADLGIPRIHFGVNTGELLDCVAATGPEVVGVDWRIPLDVAGARLQSRRAVQGNLDPALCLGPWAVVEPEVLRVLAEGARHPGGHIFNLGHGVLPETDPSILERIVEVVHATPATSP
jgi:uroporphyrinogen decarboxylase